MASPRKERSKDVREFVVTLYLSKFKQGEISRRFEIPRTIITSVTDCFRKRRSVENIPRKGKQTNLVDRDTCTRILLRSSKVKRTRGLWATSLTLESSSNQHSNYRKEDV